MTEVRCQLGCIGQLSNWYGLPECFHVGRGVVSNLAGFYPSPRLPPRHRADSGTVGGGSVKGTSEPLTEYP